jgi:hypothetical protein
MTHAMRRLALVPAALALAAGLAGCAAYRPAPRAIAVPVATAVVPAPTVVEAPVVISRPAPIVVSRPAVVQRPMIVTQPTVVATAPVRQWVPGHYDANGYWVDGYYR